MENINKEPTYNGFSLPEMFVLGALVQLTNNDNIVPQFSPEWADKKRYDFYLKKENAIIEVHGLQHYREVEFFEGRTLKEEQENDKFKEELAKEQGIDKYVQLDCSVSNMQYMYDSIFKDKRMQEILASIDGNWKDKISLPKINKFIIENKHGYKEVCKAYLETYDTGRIKSNEQIQQELKEKNIFISYAAIDNCLRYAESAGLLTYYTPSMYKQRDIHLCSDLFDNKHKTINEIKKITGLDKDYINRMLIEGTEQGITNNYIIDTKQFNTLITLIDNKVKQMIQNNVPLTVSSIEKAIENNPEIKLYYAITNKDIYSKGYLKQQLGKAYFQDYMTAKAKIGNGEIIDEIIKEFGDDKQKMLSPIMIANKLNLNIEVFYRAIQDNDHILYNIDKACRYPAIEGHSFKNNLLEDCMRTAADMVCTKGQTINENNLRKALVECGVYSTLLKENNATSMSDLMSRDNINSIIEKINENVNLAFMTAEYTAEYELDNQYLTPQQCAKEAWVNDSVVNNNPAILAALVKRNMEVMMVKHEAINIGTVAENTGITIAKLGTLIKNEEFGLKDKILENQNQQIKEVYDYINKRGKEEGKYTINYINEEACPYKLVTKKMKQYIIEKECAEMLKKKEPINYQSVIKNTGIGKDFIYESHGSLNGSKTQIDAWAKKQSKEKNKDER